MPFRQILQLALEEVEALTDLAGDLRDREHVRPSGRQHDPERHAMHDGEDLPQRTQILLAESERGIHPLGRIDEQLHAARLQRLLWCVPLGLEPPKLEHRLAGDVQLGPRGHQYVDPGRRPQNIGDQRRTLRQMLEVVHHEQLALSGQVLKQLIACRLVARHRHADRLGHRLHHVVDRLDGRQLDEEDALGVGIAQLGRKLKRESGLSGTARGEDGEQPAVGQQAPRLRQFLLPAVELRQLLGQVVRGRAERLEWGEGVRQAVDDELEHVLGFCEVFEPVLAQVAHRGPLRQRIVLHHLVRAGSQQRLTAVSQRPHTGASIHDGAVVVAVPQMGEAGVQPDADPDLRLRRPFLLGELGLDRHSGRHRVGGIRKHGEAAVAFASLLDDDAIPNLDTAFDDGVVPVHGLRHHCAIGLPQPSRALDIGEEKGDRSRRQPRHRPQCTATPPP